MCTTVRDSLRVQQLGEDDVHVHAHTLSSSTQSIISYKSYASIGK